MGNTRPPPPPWNDHRHLCHVVVPRDPGYYDYPEQMRGKSHTTPKKSALIATTLVAELLPIP